MNMKYCARTFSIFLFISFISAQTYVPDDNFEQALIDLGYDDVLDDYVVTDSINTVTTLNVENDSISDLTGIEGFTALTNLNCSYNQLTSLDMSSNTALTEMNCARNDLTSLDVSSNTALTELNCHSNQLTSLDVSNNTALTEMNCAINDLTSLDVSSNTALTDLRCYSNNLTSLDVSNNTALTEMRCARNELTSLDVSSNTALTHLSCNDNQLTSLDVSSNTALTRLYCYTNQLDSLDVSSNTELTKLICGNNSLASLDLSNNADLTELHLGVNQLTSLDVSSNTALTRLTCNGNQLTYLNMKNGVTDGLTNFNVTNNDSLDCIETLDPTYATENWTYANGNIDEGVSFSQNCLNPAGYTYVPDDNFEQALIDLGYDDVLDDYVITDSINTVTTLNVSNDSISDLTGIEDFIALTYLFCAQNQLTSLNMSSNTALTHLYCANNDLTSIDVSNNTSLLVIHCHYNDLTSLDLSENILLTNLEAWNNNLASLDVSNNIALSVLNLHHNDLTSMDISSNTALTDLNINHNDMESLDVSQNTELTKLYVGSNSLTSLDVSANTALDDFRCYNNQLTSLDVSNNTLLTYLHTGTNQLTDLDVSQNTELTTMYVGSNSLTSLDVSSNTALTNLYCKENQLTSLDVRANIALAILNCSNNDLTNLDVSSNTALTHLVCNETQLTSLDLSNNTALTYLHSAENQLTSLDVSSNTALTDLHFSENQITILDVSNNTLLTLLSCADNQLTSLDVSNNTALAHIDCHENQLTSLDVSNNTSLTWLQCYGNQLTYLNMKNGITDALTTFNATNNDSLECIETLDPTYATENWTYADGNIDEGVTFEVHCIPFIGPVWHVSTTGSDSTGDGSEDNPFATIQTALNNANVSDYENIGNLSDTIIVHDGIYVIDELGDEVLSHDIYSDGSYTTIIISENGPASTILEGSNEYSSIGVTEVGYTLHGFTLDGFQYFGSGDNIEFNNCLLIRTISFSATSCPEPCFTFNNSTFTENDVDQIDQTSLFLNSIIYNNTNLSLNDTDTIRYCIHDLDFDGVGSINTDPLFCNPDSGDFTLAENSPAVGAGENGTNIGAFGVGCGIQVEWDFSLSEPMLEIMGTDNVWNPGDTISVEMDFCNNTDVAHNWYPGVTIESDSSLTSLHSGHIWFYAMVVDECHTISWGAIANTSIISDTVVTFSAYPEALNCQSQPEYCIDGDTLTFEVPIVVQVVSVEPEPFAPEQFSLHQNYPNPFNPFTALRYDIPKNSHVTITIYDMLGKQVKTLINQTQDAGYQSVVWDATNDYGRPVSAGIYLYQIQAGEYIQTKKMVLLK